VPDPRAVAANNVHPPELTSWLLGGKIPAMTNTFWIAANIVFDLRTGERKDVLTLVNHEIDATFFTESDALNYKNFVQSRADDIQWFVEQTRLRGPSKFVIRGVQNV
jgi:hypothetical protein